MRQHTGTRARMVECLKSESSLSATMVPKYVKITFSIVIIIIIIILPIVIIFLLKITYYRSIYFVQSHSLVINSKFTRSISLHLHLQAIFHKKICMLGSRDSAVGIAAGYGLDGREIGLRVPVGSRISSYSRRPD
jgi:hypothetical protein